VVVEFMGTLVGGGGNPTQVGIYFDTERFPDFESCSHEGHSMYDWANLASEAPAWAETYAAEPDVVLLAAGTNDAYYAFPLDESLAAAEATVAWIDARFPDAQLVIALPPPLADLERDADRAALSELLRERWAGRKRVDLGELIEPATMLKDDGIHLAPAGERVMAAAFEREVALE